jgi:Protein of unknown function (DUF3168)
MGYESAVHKIVLDALQADVPLSALVGERIYDNVPQNLNSAAQADVFPYVTIGEDVHTAWDAHYEVGSSASITVHTWSRARGRIETKNIQGAIYNALNRKVFTSAGYDIIGTDFEGSETFIDADGFTRHGVSVFRVLLQKTVN